jgi:hypothetical protein
MRAIVTPPQARPTADWLIRDIRRALLICACAGACTVVGVLSVGSPLFRPPPPTSAAEAGLSTGSLLFVAPAGNLCQERTIDNETWRIRDGSLVNCAQALAKSASPELASQWSGSRIDIIREGFRRGR